MGGFQLIADKTAAWWRDISVVRYDYNIRDHRDGEDKSRQKKNVARVVTGKETGHITYLNWLNNIRVVFLFCFLHYLHYVVGHTWVRKLKTQHLTKLLWLTCWPAITLLHSLLKVGLLHLLLHLDVLCKRYEGGMEGVRGEGVRGGRTTMRE